MSTTRGALISDTLARLGDSNGAIWSRDEVALHLTNAYQQLAQGQRVFWDWVYLENLPATFSYTAKWEALYGYVTYDAGIANYTVAAEKRLLNDELNRLGPACCTSLFLVTDGWLSAVQGTPAIPATADLPGTVTDLARGTFDRRGIDALNHRDLVRADSRYELTTGEVFGYLWQKDGVRTVRKVRVPAAVATTYTVNGSWGALRRPTDLSSVTVTGTFGIPRRIPSQHPIGMSNVGLPRRPYADGKNCRFEVWRLGRPLLSDGDLCELPDRYTLYLRDYAMARCLAKVGAGQDLKLSALFDARWTRHLARVQRRLQKFSAQRMGTLGAQADRLIERPARPKLPWPYGVVVR